MRLSLNRRGTVAAALFCVATVAVSYLWSSRPARAAFTPDPYQVTQVVDTDPSPDVVETTITAQAAAVDIGGGTLASVLTYNGTLPGPEFRLKVGDTVIVHFVNNIAHDTGIHWHGIELANASDGTPLTQNQVVPGGTFLYKFKVTRPGLYWYHPHHHSSTNQVFKGLVGSIIVTDPNEAPLITAGVLPPASQTRTFVLSDVTVCKAVGSNDTATYAPSLPFVTGAMLPAQASPTPKELCETSPIDENGAARAAFAAGDVPNIQKPGTAGRVNEGQTVLTNGVNVGSRAGSPTAPGALAAGAIQFPVQAGQGLRLQLINVAAVRFFRLRLTTSTGVLVPLVRIGGQGGLLDQAVIEGGLVGGFDFKYDTGQILLDPGAREDVVAAIPSSATGVLTLWTEDLSRTGLGFSNLPTVPVAHFTVSGSAPAYTIAAGTLLRQATGNLVEALGPATATLLDPSTFPVPKPGLAGQNITLGNTPTALVIDGVVGVHEVAGDYAKAPHMGSSRYAGSVPIGSTLELTVQNGTTAHHPFHLHGFSIQPIDLTRAGSPTYTFPYREFKDNVDVPALYTLRYRVRLDDRPLMDGSTPGGAYGRWVFHCHILFHAVFGMISEFNVVASNGNERPNINTNATASQGYTSFTLKGTYFDRDGGSVALTTSSGNIVADDASNWTWTRAGGASGRVYVTATDSGGLKDQVAFDVVNACPTISLGPASLANGVANVLYGPVSLSQSGGVGTTTFAVTNGAVPAGMTLSAAGVLSGTPTAMGSSTFTVTATDANTCPGSRAYTLTIDCPTLAMTPATIPAASAGRTFSQALTATGAVVTPVFSVVAGAVPVGLTLSNAGALTGTPTKLERAAFTVSASSGSSCAVQRDYAVDVNPARLVITGPGAGGALGVKAFDPNGSPAPGALTDFFAFGAGFTGGVRVAAGDMNGDGVTDVIAAPSSGSEPVRVFNGASGLVMREFFAYPWHPPDGVHVAVADVTGDGALDIVTATGSGAPAVRVFDGKTGAMRVEFFGDSETATGGVRVAAGDLNGDGYAEIITGAGPLSEPVVRVFSAAGTLLRSFVAYPAGFAGGVYVATGDVNGDGFGDIVTGPGPGGGPHVRVWDGRTSAELRGFFAYAPQFSGGVRVAAGDVNGDGRAEVITSAGPGGPHVRVWDGATGTEFGGFFAYAASFAGGVFAAAQAPRNLLVVDAPQPNAQVSNPFSVVGWALSEWGSTGGNGVSTLHVWAYPVAGGTPRFVGAGAPVGSRPDVAAILGGQFASSGFTVNASSLPSGTYDLVVFAFNERTATVTDRRLVRIVVQ